MGAEQGAIICLSCFVGLPDRKIQGVWGEQAIGLTQGIGAVAVPAIMRRVINHGGAYRMELDIALAGHKVGVGMDE